MAKYEIGECNVKKEYIFLGICGKKGHYRMIDKTTGEIEREGDYDNIYIQVAMPFVPQECHTFMNGFCAGEIKCTRESAPYVFNTDKFNVDDYRDWMFKKLDVQFNRKGTLVSVSLCE